MYLLIESFSQKSDGHTRASQKVTGDPKVSFVVRETLSGKPL